MPRVRFEPANVEIDVRPGRRLVDVTDEHPEAAVPYSCRSASCGTCRVRVPVGMEAFAPPEDEELSVLDIFGDGPDTRLCCQLRVIGDAPRVTVRVVDP
jgi:2Fe-2S ferredoxin